MDRSETGPVLSASIKRLSVITVDQQGNEFVFDRSDPKNQKEKIRKQIKLSGFCMTLTDMGNFDKADEACKGVICRMGLKIQIEIRVDPMDTVSPDYTVNISINKIKFKIS